MKGDRGFCPSCHGVGRLAEPCPGEGCRKLGYHFIPAAYYQESSEQPEAFQDPLVGRCLEEYLVVAKLGKGGFSRVYLALQLPVLMKAAIKLLLARSGKATIDRADLDSFQVEAAALARLSHPNIVRLLKYGGHHEPPYLALEYVEEAQDLHGELYGYTCRGQWPDTGDVRDILRQVLFALESAHGHGVMHGDINPNNILLQDLPGYPRLVRILDFGLGRLMDEEQDEEPTGIFGTGVYIAPETVTGDPVGPWTDLYAVGVLAFLLLFKDIPFHCSSRKELLSLKTDERYDPSTVLRDRGAPVEVLDFFRRALAVRPERRYRQAKELAGDLERIFGLASDGSI